MVSITIITDYILVIRAGDSALKNINLIVTVILHRHRIELLENPFAIHEIVVGTHILTNSKVPKLFLITKHHEKRLQKKNLVD